MPKPYYIGLLIIPIWFLTCSMVHSNAVQPLLNKDMNNQQLYDFLEENYNVDMQQYPKTAVLRGIKDNNQDWNSKTQEFKNQRQQIIKQRLAKLQTFDRKKLSPEADLSWQLYEQKLLRSIASDKFRYHAYAIHHHRGVHTSVPTFMLNKHAINTIAEAEDYIKRLNTIDTLFDQIIEEMRLSEGKKILLPKWSYTKTIKAARGIIIGYPFDQRNAKEKMKNTVKRNILWADFEDKVKDLNLSPKRSQILLGKAKHALITKVNPAYQRLISELERLESIASNDDGAWKHPNGADFYAERLNYYTTTEWNAEQVHTIGLREVARIHKEMREIMRTLKFDGSLADFFVFVRNDPQFYYENNDAGRHQYLKDAKEFIEKMKNALPNVFNTLPQSELIVKQIPAYREKSAGKAYYHAPSINDSRPGTYFVNLYDMKSMPIYQMEALAYHEGIPGHHLQRGLSLELENVPEFQKYSRYTAYIEGWALYAERLPKGMGFYTDPMSDFGRLAMELWRTCRLVVDTGIHHKRWTREQAIAYLIKNTSNSKYDATKAIERYIVTPGQATAYLVGQLKILELREKARTAMGMRFNLRDFHKEVLKDGPVPLFILENKINAMISRD